MCTYIGIIFGKSLCCQIADKQECLTGGVLQTTICNFSWGAAENEKKKVWCIVKMVVRLGGAIIENRQSVENRGS